MTLGLSSLSPSEGEREKMPNAASVQSVIGSTENSGEPWCGTETVHTQQATTPDVRLTRRIKEQNQKEKKTKTADKKKSLIEPHLQLTTLIGALQRMVSEPTTC